ncbi:DUF4158 domain-containing protein [bacterium]|nr:DUF4158 domain-containing protein [bacterium]
MKGDYPAFREAYSQQELHEFFSLDEAELTFIKQFKTESNRFNVAVLLKALLYLGYFPEHPSSVPEGIRTYVSFQLGLLFDHSQDYPYEGGTKDFHISAIRKYSGFRFTTDADRDRLQEWLESEAAFEAPTEEGLLEAAYDRFRDQRIELPPENRQRTRRLPKCETIMSLPDTH